MVMPKRVVKVCVAIPKTSDSNLATINNAIDIFFNGNTVSNHNEQP